MVDLCLGLERIAEWFYYRNKLISAGSCWAEFFLFFSASQSNEASLPILIPSSPSHIASALQGVNVSGFEAWLSTGVRNFDRIVTSSSRTLNTGIPLYVYDTWIFWYFICIFLYCVCILCMYSLILYSQSQVCCPSCPQRSTHSLGVLIYASSTLKDLVLNPIKDGRHF